MEQMILSNIRGWNVSSTDSTDNMFNDAIALLQNPIYRFIPNGWVNLSEGTPNNSIFFSNVAAIPPFTPLNNSHFFQWIKLLF